MHQRCTERAVWFLLCFAIQIISQGLFPPWIKGWLFARSTDMEKSLWILLQPREPRAGSVLPRARAVESEHGHTAATCTRCTIPTFSHTTQQSSLWCFARRLEKGSRARGALAGFKRVWDLGCPENWAENNNNNNRLGLHRCWVSHLSAGGLGQEFLKAKPPLTITAQTQSVPISLCEQQTGAQPPALCTHPEQQH